jgi:Uma2 family endonuclease
LLDMLAALGARRLTVAEYHTMHDAGILMEGERVELIDGYLVEKPMRNPPHDGAVTRITNRLPRRIPAGWVPRVQSAVTFTGSEPEPDAAIVRGDDTSYDARHPDPGDFGIIIEVSDSSLLFDRRVKGRMYAEVNIPVYWIVNVVDRQVEVYTGPDPAANPAVYRNRTDYRPGDTVPLVLDGQPAGGIPVDDLLPQ